MILIATLVRKNSTARTTQNKRICLFLLHSFNQSEKRIEFTTLLVKVKERQNKKQTYEENLYKCQSIMLSPNI